MDSDANLSIVISSDEWLPLFENLQSCPNIPAYFRELSDLFENDKRQDSKGFIRLQPLSQSQAEAQLANLLDYFDELPEDWEYTTAEELTRAVQNCPFLQPSSAAYLELNSDFSYRRSIASARAAIRADAKRLQAERSLEHFKMDMYTVDARHQQIKDDTRSRCVQAIRRGQTSLAVKLLRDS